MLDAHFHLLSMEEKEIDVKSHLRLCKDSEVFALLDMGTREDDINKRASYFNDGYPLYFASGIYPENVTRLNSESKIDEAVSTLASGIKNSNIPHKAIGEIGIELFHDVGHLELQLYLLEKQIMLANSLNLPVVIHNRNADSVVLNQLKKTMPTKGGVIHCFSSDKKAAFDFLDLGLKLSFSGNITYKNNITLQEAIVKVPLSSILIETDSPYLTPQPVRKFPNSPIYIGYTYEAVSQLKNQKIQNIITAVKENFSNLFLS